MINKKYKKDIHGVFIPSHQKNFNYCDGINVEKNLLNIIISAKNKNTLSNELILSCTDWPTTYHLSPARSNLIRPIETLIKDKKILELGAGCGALTRYFGEKSKEVTAVEGSYDRANIAAKRCEDLNNVTIINDTIQEVELSKKYDVVTLIGVLEYSRIYDLKSKCPEVEILKTAKKFLTKNGILIIAIENRLGIKYLAGAIEDHAGKPYYGINSNYSENSIATFGRIELEKIIAAAGFNYAEQFIPLPDYKLPITVLTPKSLNLPSTTFDPTNLAVNSVAYDYNYTLNFTFSAEEMYKIIIKNNLLKDLCNSFLYIASNHKLTLSENLIAKHYSKNRLAEYLTETTFNYYDDKIIVSKNTIIDNKFKDKEGIFNNLGDDIFLPSETMFTTLSTIINRLNWNIENLATWATPWVNTLSQIKKQKINNIECIDSKYIDLIPPNCIISKNNLVTPIDLEWRHPGTQHIPLNYVIFRGIWTSISRFRSVAKPSQNTPLTLIDICNETMLRLNIDITGKDVINFLRFENNFQQKVCGKYFDIEQALRTKINTRLFT